MEMSKSEIVANYKAAKSPKAQVQILADLNVCSVGEIVKILDEAGVLTKQQKGAYKRHGQIEADSPAPVPVPAPAPVPVPAPALVVPSAVLELVRSELDLLADEYEKALEVVRYVEELRAFLNDNKKD